jgi:HPt (histidine-containing phosphotransfer) domain-containing protein
MMRLPPAEAMPSESEPVIDLGRVHSFTDGDPQLESELLTLFLSTADVYLAKMNQALRAGEPWTATAHALKGASANLGACRVMALALAAEHAAASAEQLDALHKAIEEVRALAHTMPG